MFISNSHLFYPSNALYELKSETLQKLKLIIFHMQIIRILYAISLTSNNAIENEYFKN